MRLPCPRFPLIDIETYYYFNDQKNGEEIFIVLESTLMFVVASFDEVFLQL